MTNDQLIREAHRLARLPRVDRLDLTNISEFVLDRARLCAERVTNNLALRRTHVVSGIAADVCDLVRAYDTVEARIRQL